jgi:hypothetical protein
LLLLYGEYIPLPIVMPQLTVQHSAGVAGFLQEPVSSENTNPLGQAADVTSGD